MTTIKEFNKTVMNQKGNITPILVIVIVVLGLLGWLLLQKAPTKTTAPTPSATQQTPTPTNSPTNISGNQSQGGTWDGSYTTNVSLTCDNSGMTDSIKQTVQGIVGSLAVQDNCINGGTVCWPIDAAGHATSIDTPNGLTINGDYNFSKTGIQAKVSGTIDVSKIVINKLAPIDMSGGTTPAPADNGGGSISCKGTFSGNKT